MKKDRQTQNAMRDRYNWLKGLAKLRNYNFNGRENDYLFVLYSTMRSVFSPELSNVLLSLCNGSLAYPRSDDAIAKIIEHTKNRDRPCKYHNEDIVSKLKITEQEIATLQIGHNKKVVEERKIRASQKESVQTWVKAYYGMGYTTAEIAQELPSVSKRTIQRYLAKNRKEQALEDAEETASIAAKIIDMYRNNVDIVQIARQTKSTVDDVRRILGLGGMTDFIKQEIKCTKNELQGFKSPDCLELFSLTSYNEERTLTGLDEHTTAMAILQTFTGNICITGAGGTGKTFLINQFLESLSPEEKASTLIVCPTGKAADHLNGITIHKAFHLSNDIQLPDAITTVPKELLSVTRIIKLLHRQHFFSRVNNRIAVAAITTIKTTLSIFSHIFNGETPFLLPPLGILNQISCIAWVLDIADDGIRFIHHVLICPNNGKRSGYIFKRRVIGIIKTVC